MPNTEIDRRLLLGAVGLAGIAALSHRASAGPLDPPAGPLGSTGKTLDQVEPRTPIGPTTTPGDATSVYRITQPGSYYLTGNVQGVSGRASIAIAASDVSLDLCGFVLQGAGGVYPAIFVIGNQRSLTIRNGVIRNHYAGIQGTGSGLVLTDVHVAGAVGEGIQWAGGAVIERCAVVGAAYGIYLLSDSGGDPAVVRDCVVRQCAYWGISAAEDTSILHCAVTECPAGIRGGPNCFVAHCVASAPTTEPISPFFEYTPIWVGEGAMVTDCVASGGTSAIRGAGRSLIQRCSARGASRYGIEVGDYSEVVDCRVLDNLLGGINAAQACRILRNHCESNGGGSATGYQISVSNDCHVQANTLHNAPRGIVGSSITNSFVVGNVLRAHPTPFAIPLGNTLGVVVNAAGNMAFASTNPYANILY